MIVLAGFEGNDILGEVAKSLQGRGMQCAALGGSPPSGFTEGLRVSNGTFISSTSLHESSWRHREFLSSKSIHLGADLLLNCHENLAVFSRLVDRTIMRAVSGLDTGKYLDSLLFQIDESGLAGQNVEAVIFSSVPHSPVEFALFLVARFRNISIYVFRPTQLPDTVVLTRGFSENRFESVSVPRSLAAPGKISNLVDSIRLRRSKLLNMQMQEVPLLKELTWYAYLALFRVGLSPRYIQKFRRRSPLKVPAAAMVENRLQTYALFRDATVNRRKRIRALRRQVQALPKGRFIYLALHFQPERSTDPESGLFSNQLRAIEVLDSVATRIGNLSIVVKEHPKQMQFPPNPREFAFRSVEFYECMSKFRNVVFVGPSFSTERLITESSVVATCTGSASWEALVAGRPVINFAASWLSGCEALTSVSSVGEATAAFERLVEMTPLEVRSALESFLATNQGLLRGVLSVAHLSSEAQLSKVVDDLASFLEFIVYEEIGK